MAKFHPTSLGDVYPALCNFLKLTALALGVPQLALTVQVGIDAQHTGVLSYGHITQVVLRQMLEQPMPALLPLSETFAVGTLYRRGGHASNGLAPRDPGQAVLVGRLHPAQSSYYLTLYVPGLMAETLTTVQMKTLSYLTQQLVLCLRAIPLPPDLVPPPLEPDLEDTEDVASDFLSRVVSLNSAHSITEGRVQQRYPRLVDLVTDLQSCLSYKQLGHLLEIHLPPFFPHQSGRLVLLSGNPPSFTVLTSWGDESEFLGLDQSCCFLADQPVEPGPGTCKTCHQCDRAKADQPHSSCILLGTLNQTTSILQLTRPSGGEFNLGQTALLQKLSEQILFVMQRLFLLEDLQDKALKDPLTGLLNRRQMENVLANICSTANVQQQVSVILIDIDYFKQVNDTFGHLVGDRVLKDLSILLRGHVRSQDIVCRYGGEEFCMVLLDTPLDVALKRAENIRRAVKYLTLDYNGKTLDPLTVSLGVASFPDHGQDPETLINYADKALYWAKNHGRDRTTSADQVFLEAP